MKTYLGAIAVALAAQFGVNAPQPARADPDIVTGKPCVDDSGICLRFSGGDNVNLINSITISAKKKAKASITVAGTMQCVYSGTASGAGAGVIDVSGQIVAKGDKIDLTKAGASRYAFRLPPSAPSFGDYSAPINLASTRVVSLKSGKNDFQFKMAKNRMDAGTSCTVFFLNLSAVVVD